MTDGFAWLLFREKGKRHRVEALVQRGAQIEHDVLANRFRSVFLGDADQSGKQRTCDHAEAAQP